MAHLEGRRTLEKASSGCSCCKAKIQPGGAGDDAGLLDFSDETSGKGLGKALGARGLEQGTRHGCLWKKAAQCLYWSCSESSLAGAFEH